MTASPSKCSQIWAERGDELRARVGMVLEVLTGVELGSATLFRSEMSRTWDGATRIIIHQYGRSKEHLKLLMEGPECMEAYVSPQKTDEETREEVATTLEPLMLSQDADFFVDAFAKQQSGGNISEAVLVTLVSKKFENFALPGSIDDSTTLKKVRDRMLVATLFLKEGVMRPAYEAFDDQSSKLGTISFHLRRIDLETLGWLLTLRVGLDRGETLASGRV